MALQTGHFRIAASAYLIVTILVTWYALTLHEFPEGVSQPLLILLGPFVWLLPIKWTPDSVIYFAFLSAVFVPFYWWCSKARNRTRLGALVFATLFLWVLTGFVGLMVLAIASA